MARTEGATRASTRRGTRRTTYDVQSVTLHGHRRAFVRAGRGPVLLLLHGLGCDHQTWLPVLSRLARYHTVIAPDLLGHGSSDKPRADYSLGGYANGMRDLLTVLGLDKATVVGHSFGGGVAMQFAYQFPERTERVILVSSGGLGPEVTPAIRAVTTPGFQHLLGLLALPGLRHLTTAGMRVMSHSGLPQARDLDELAAILDSFRDPRSRTAVAQVVRSVVDWRGQIVTMSDRAYLTAAMPMLLLWGADDTVIPPQHLENAARLAPDLHTAMLDDCGHFPHKDQPERFVELVEEFMAQTRPATYSRARFRAMLRAGPPTPSGQAEDGRVPSSPLQAVPPA